MGLLLITADKHQYEEYVSTDDSFLFLKSIISGKTYDLNIPEVS